MNVKFIAALLVIFTAAQIAASQKTDLTITDISRVAGKNELKVTILNKGQVDAKSGSLKIYALPYGFCASASDYNAIIEANSACVNKPFEIPQPMRFSSIENTKNRLGLAWTSVTTDHLRIAPDASVEQIVQFPAQPILQAGTTPKKVFPVPFVKESELFFYAPMSLAKFDLSVFYAEVDSEAEADKTNNAYFFNIRRRPLN